MGQPTAVILACCLGYGPRAGDLLKFDRPVRLVEKRRPVAVPPISDRDFDGRISFWLAGRGDEFQPSFPRRPAALACIARYAGADEIRP